MTRRTAALLAFIAPITALSNSPCLRAQSPSALFGKPSGPKFEVVSIKPAPNIQTVISQGQTPHMGIKINPSTVDIGYWSITQLILRAYGLGPYQLYGPNWMDSARFDVVAKFPHDVAPDQLSGMLQWVIVERLGLAAHSESKDLPAFALSVAKSGPKMKPADPDDSISDEASLNRIEKIGRTLDSIWGSGTELGLTTTTGNNGNLHLEFTKMPMAALVQILASYLRAPVIDVTGLQGKYRATLDFSLADTLEAARTEDPSGGSGAPSVSEPFGTSLFAMVQRLGLKLERRKAHIDVLIVDHVERVPSAN